MNLYQIAFLYFLQHALRNTQDNRNSLYNIIKQKGILVMNNGFQNPTHDCTLFHWFKYFHKFKDRG